MKKTSQLRTLLNSGQTEFIMEAHNGISAKIVEEAGFKGIWASGLSISAALGVRDNNEASWTQVLEVLEFMSDATSIPILLDGDTGYGNFNNMRRLVKKLEQRNVGGVCIEDKLFPKTNSFINSEAQPLADIDEFCGKIAAAKDEAKDPDFCVVARVEAFIAGWGLDEALRRAEAYREAGADAILIHSKKSNSSDIDAFMKEWGGRHPVVIVPTKYYSIPTDHFRDIGVSLIIWANHNMRAAVRAMQEVSSQVFHDQSLINVENQIIGVDEVFRLQGAEELEQAEKKYLPTTGKKVSGIILAASQGDFGALTKDIPKTLLKVNGKEILARQIKSFNYIGIKDITVVRGFAPEKFAFDNINYIDNVLYGETKDLYSLYLARNQIKADTLISYGDIIFKDYILNELFMDNSSITIIVDADHEERVEGGNRDWIVADLNYSKTAFLNKISLVKIDSSIHPGGASGEFIGLWKVNEQGAALVRDTLERMGSDEAIKNMTMADLFNELLKKSPITVKYIKGSWVDIDTIVDLQRGEEIL